MDRCRPWSRPAGRSEAMNVVAPLALVPLALIAVMGLSWLENHFLSAPAQPGDSPPGSRRTCRTAGQFLAPGGGFAPGGQQPRARRCRWQQLERSTYHARSARRSQIRAALRVP